MPDALISKSVIFLKDLSVSTIVFIAEFEKENM